MLPLILSPMYYIIQIQIQVQVEELIPWDPPGRAIGSTTNPEPVLHNSNLSSSRRTHPLGPPRTRLRMLTLQQQIHVQVGELIPWDPSGRAIGCMQTGVIGPE